eukprot:SAG31_NODE_37648_length_302_cov_1.221675_1_plen_24_part_10
MVTVGRHSSTAVYTAVPRSIVLQA